MKKVDRFSIGGYAFTMETEAATAAGKYLGELEAFYANSEITEGIEERMAELLLEKKGDAIIDKETVEEIIDILGRPDRLEMQEDTDKQPARKLYRDMSRARIAGVCSGLSSYFDIDVVIFRLIFTALAIAGLFGGFRGDSGAISLAVPVAYAVLWICIPAAKTARQRWELRGEDGTAESIRRTVERGAAEVGDAVRSAGNSPAWSRIGRILSVIAGLLLLVISVTGLFSGILAVFGWEWLGFGPFLTDVMSEVSYDFPWIYGIVGTFWVRLLCGAVYFLPFIGMLYGSMMLIFGFKSPSWHPGLVIFITWLITLIALAVLILGCVFSAQSLMSI